MLRQKSLIVFCSFIILAVAIMGVCLEVTPAAAAAVQNASIPNSGNPATNLHGQAQGAGLNAAPPAGQSTSQPLAEKCLLCYSPSHNLLSRLSMWLGK